MSAIVIFYLGLILGPGLVRRQDIYDPAIIDGKAVVLQNGVALGHRNKPSRMYQCVNNVHGGQDTLSRSRLQAAWA